MEDTTVADRDCTVNVNLLAAFVLSKAMFPHMRRTGGGTIINVSSIAGFRGR